MRRYASQTSVPMDRSRGEIEKVLVRYGATGFMYGWRDGAALIMFEAQGRRVKFELPMPDRNDKEFTMTPGGRRKRHPDDAVRAWEQAQRQRWRALALVIKAKLEAVASAITTFEEEFLAHILLPNGETVGEYMGPQIEVAYREGTMPPLLSAAARGGNLHEK